MSKEPTTPASGSDGLETAIWARPALEALAGYERDAGPLDDMHELGRIDDSRDSPSFRIRVGHIRDLTALVTREAAEKRIGELLDANAELHELLVSGQSQVAALKAALETARETIKSWASLARVGDVNAGLDHALDLDLDIIDQALALKEGQ